MGASHTLIRRRNLQKKWEPKSNKMFLVGYQGESKNYRLFNPLTNKIIVSRDVIFNEKARYNKIKDEDDISFNVRLNNSSDNTNEHDEIEHIENNKSKSVVVETGKSYELRNRDKLKQPDRSMHCII